MRYFETFVRNKSQMQIWAPKENQVSINERTKEKIFNHRFWESYLNETNDMSMDEMLVEWEDPYPWNVEAVYGAFNNTDKLLYAPESESSLTSNEETEEFPKARDMSWFVMFEAKQAEDQPFTTLFTKEVFEEMIRFEKWLYFDVKYY